MICRLFVLRSQITRMKREISVERSGATALGKRNHCEITFERLLTFHLAFVFTQLRTS